jgi:hypothetical protein
MRVVERVNFIRGIDEQMRINKESNMFNKVNHQIPNMNKVDKKNKLLINCD